MNNTHCISSASVLRDVCRSQAHRHLPPAFLLPAFAPSQKSSFSTTSPVAARKDGNTRRGMSALKPNGLNKRLRLSVKLKDLPQPVLDPNERSKITVDPDHGLWGFFDKERSALMSPIKLSEHGRAWTVSELRRKNFDELWKLYWTCMKEVNRINTYELERQRLKLVFGEHEAGVRLDEAKKTQKAIRHALTERWYQFEDARGLAMEDPEINLYANATNDEPAYTPSQDPFEPEESTRAAESRRVSSTDEVPRAYNPMAGA